jgi:hypothetical protein
MCVFKVKYDGREIPCDYTELVLFRYTSGMSNVFVNKIYYNGGETYQPTYVLTHDGIGVLIFKRVTVVPGKDVDAVKGFASAFVVHPLHELANTFPLQKTVLIVAK